MTLMPPEGSPSSFAFFNASIFISGLKHESAAGKSTRAHPSFLYENLSKSYSKLNSEEQEAPKQVSHPPVSSGILKSRSHPCLELTTSSPEPDNKSTNSSPYHLANGLTASLAISTAPSQTGVSAPDPQKEAASADRPAITWSDVMRIAKEQNKMQINKKSQAKQDVGKAERSLFCLRLSNPIRRACLRLVEWK